MSKLEGIGEAERREEGWGKRSDLIPPIRFIWRNGKTLKGPEFRKGGTLSDNLADYCDPAAAVGASRPPLLPATH